MGFLKIVFLLISFIQAIYNINKYLELNKSNEFLFNNYLLSSIKKKNISDDEKKNILKGRKYIILFILFGFLIGFLLDSLIR